MNIIVIADTIMIIPTTIISIISVTLTILAMIISEQLPGCIPKASEVICLTSSLNDLFRVSTGFYKGFCKVRVPFRVLSKRALYWDLTRDPNLENYLNPKP